jgi:DNA-binding XRE family transcriptional regulator
MVNSIGKALAERGLSQSWLADATGLRPLAIGRVIHGKADPSLETAMRIAHALGTTVDELFTLDPKIIEEISVRQSLKSDGNKPVKAKKSVKPETRPL